MDVIRRLGGLRLRCGGGEKVEFGLAAAEVAEAADSSDGTQMVMEDADFSVSFNGTK